MKETINLLDYLNIFHTTLCNCTYINAKLKNKDKILFLLTSLLLFYKHVVIIMFFFKDKKARDSYNLFFFKQEIKTINKYIDNKTPNSTVMNFEALFLRVIINLSKTNQSFENA